MRKRSTLVAAAVMGLMALPAWALDGRIVQVGYPMSATFDDTLDDTSGAQKYRLGTWVPIQVELFSEENAPLFEGSLRVIQPDRDGDLAVTSEPVAVRGLRRYWLYTVAAPTRDEQPFVVQVLDADGNVVTLRDSYSGKDSERLIPSSRPLALGTQDRVVLDISARPVSQLYRLASKDAYSANQADRETTQPIVIGRHAARDLPGHRCGLDLVDVIVWDAADPASLTDAAHQMRALTEWVYHGGVLVLGVGQTWQTVQKSALAPLLPGPLTGTQQAETLPEMATFLDSEERSASGTTDPTALKAPITICPIARDSLRTGSRIMDFGREASDRVLVCRRRAGRGEIVYVGAELRDLYAQGGRTDDLTARLLAARWKPQSDDASESWGTTVELWQRIWGLIGFETTVGLYFLFGVVFVVIYILISTLGAWQWLKSRGWTKHSWTTFAALAIVASLLSLGAVQVIRGIGYDVQVVSIVDMAAGDYAARADCYYGVKTSSHERLDLLLPEDWTAIDPAAETACTLQPLPSGPNIENTYVAAEEYQLLPTRGRLYDVAFRATLKQFQGTWRGQTGGRITASLACRRDGTSYRLLPGSWIQNQLGTHLYGCVLIHAQTDPSPMLAQRRERVAMQVIPIGEPVSQGLLRQGQTLRGLDAMAYGPEGSRQPEGLAYYQRQWAGKLGVRAEELVYYDEQEKRAKVTTDNSEAALLLATTFGEFKMASQGTLRDRELARTYLEDLDLSDLLTKDAMLLVGFSIDPGPTRLCYRRAGSNRSFRALQVHSALTMVRVLIPVDVRE